MSRQPRLLVASFNGTWAGGLGSSRKTVVQELVGLISEDENVFEISINGVGSNGGLVDKILGGISGWGTLHNVFTAFSMDSNRLYLPIAKRRAENIAKHYKPCDRIILHGYSRGAWAARYLAMIIDLLGLPKGGDDELFHRLYKAFDKDTILTAGIAEKLLDGRECWVDVNIQALCCFDTVGSLGLPLAGFAKPLAFLHDKKSKHDIVSNVTSNVRFAFHCLSLHETREPYTPTLMSGCNVYQVFFPGSHGNLGWIENKQDLVYGPLAWMIQQLHAHVGIIFDEKKLAARFPSFQPESDAAFSAAKWYNGRIDHVNPCLLKFIGSKAREPGHINCPNGDTDLKIHIGARLRCKIDGAKTVPGYILMAPVTGRPYWTRCMVQRSRWRRNSSSTESLSSKKSNSIPVAADSIEEAPVGGLEAKLLGLPQEIVMSS